MNLPPNLIIPEALNLHNQIYQFHLKYSPCVIEWSSDSGRVQLNAAFKSKRGWLHVWYFNTFCVAGIIGFGSCLDVICHYSDQHVGQEKVVYSVVFGALCVLFCASVVVSICNTSDFIEGF